ncbi:MAG: helix-turn-helix domain-containing protein [Thermoguttaceae bacterium]|jgi:excisionase family DNA binding protein|nr:helix-turn-helix domain-containing protein [Thermoguttaceae bacterium]
MAQQKRYYTAEEAAEVLGITPGEISQRRERNELRGLKDGATWKFKVEDINALAEQLKAGRSVPTDEGDVLASEVELGPSPSGKSGTIIGPGKAHDSDIQLAGSDVKLAGSDIKLAGSDVALGGSSVKPASGVKRGSDVKLTDAALGAAPAKASDVDELDMTLDEDLKLEGRPTASVDDSAAKKGDSAIDLAGGGLDDDDVVLGGGSSSDVSIGGDSGISLVDPADSGLSLEEPVELPASDDDSLELGEDDMLTFADSADTESPTELKSDDEFLLTPLDEGAEEEESESGSQVIALDTGPVSDTAATMVAGGQRPMAAMLDEDLGVGVPTLTPAGVTPAPVPAAPGLFEPAAAAAVAPVGAPAMVLPEAPYTGWNIAALASCVVLLVLCGWVAFDLMMNMWSWNSPYGLNSALMDWVLGLF